MDAAMAAVLPGKSWQLATVHGARSSPRPAGAGNGGDMNTQHSQTERQPLPTALASGDGDLLLAQHRALLSHLDALWRSASARPTDSGAKLQMWRADLKARVSELRGELLVHFAHEDQGGVFDDLAMQAPHRCGKLGRLSQEHADIVAQIDEFLADSATQGGERLAAQAQLIVAKLRRHEAEETELILSIVYDDLGAAG